MTKNKKLLIVLFIVVVLVSVLLVVYLVRTHRPAREVSVRFPIPIIESGQSPFYLAEDKGYYLDEELKIRFEMGSRELKPAIMVASGLDTFGVLGGPDTLLVARSTGLPLKAIAIIHRNSNFPSLVTLKSSGITKLDQLEGRKVGFFYGHISTDVLRNLFRHQNIPVTEVNVGFDYNQLLNGNIDAEWAFTVTAGLDLPAQGIDINVIHPEDYGIITHGYTIFARDDFIRDHPDQVLAFLRATLRGVSDAIDSPEDATAALLRRDLDLDPNISLQRQHAYNIVTSASKDYPPGYMDRAMFQETYDRLVEENVIETVFDVSNAFTTEFVDQIYGHSSSGNDL